MKVKNNAKFSYKEIDEGECFMWREKYFIKAQKDIRSNWETAVCLEDGHIYAFKDDETVTAVNAELNID